MARGVKSAFRGYIRGVLDPNAMQRAMHAKTERDLYAAFGGGM